MTRATRKKKRKPSVVCTVVVLDAAWLRSLPGVARLVRRAARSALAGARRSAGHSLTVALADNRRVRALNKRDRKKDKPTNVLAYPSGARAFLGEVVLARETIWREARQQKKTAADHLVHLVVHGVLHLLGHDHETSAVDAERMEALERHVLAGLGIADPYLAR